MLCEDLMKTDVEWVSPADSVESAALKMRDRGIGFLPVCDKAHSPVGALTDRDIAIRLAAANARASDTRVEEIMTREAITTHPSDNIRHAQTLMGHAKVSRILCIQKDSGRLMGVISLSDITEVEVGAQAADTLREVSAREVRVRGNGGRGS
jgi:CBS domain-containing protein